MNRRQVLTAIPAVVITHKFRFAFQATPPTSADIKPFDVIITFDNKYPFDQQDLKFSDTEKETVNEAVRRWRAVWATADFRTQLEKHKLDRIQHMTHDKVYDVIMDAHPKHVNYALTNIRKGSETAVTSDTITRLQQTWIAEKEGENVNELVNTVAHEYTHTVEGGQFTHARLQRLFGKNCVPIVVGNITETISDKMFPPKAKIKGTY
jgi:hypothetical protein